MIPSRPSERGQAIVLIVLAIVGVFGVSALAIDGGMLYAERRRAQNAADTAVFAAAMTGLQKGNYEAAGLQQASMNGFTNDTTNTVTVHHPPVSGGYAGNNEYYQVFIKTEFSPFLAQFIYSGKLENTVEAVVRAKPSQSLSPGNAIHATSPDQCHAVWFQGASKTIIKGANVYSNSDAPGSTSCASGIKKSGDLEIQDGTVVTYGGFYGTAGVVIKDKDGVVLNSEAMIRDHLTESERQVITDIAPPVCTGMTVQDQSSFGTGNLQPGIYPDGIDLGKGVTTLDRGIYCLDGDIKANGGGSLIGDAGVLIYMRGTGGSPATDITVNGGGTISLKAATGTPLYDNAIPPKDWSGMVIFMRKENGGTIDLAGGATSSLWGTIYAPGPIGGGGGAKSSKCDIQGNAESFNFRAQVICSSVGITGNATLHINYNEGELFHEQPTIELSK